MNTIDARSLPQEVRDLLANAAATGGALIQIADNRRVVVIDPALWDALRENLPGFTTPVEDHSHKDKA